MRIRTKVASGIVKVTTRRRLGAASMRGVTAKKAGARVRDLTDEQAELVRQALAPFKDKCSGGGRALATMMGVDQSGFGRFLRGEQGTSWAVAMRAAAMLGLSVSELLGITPADLDFPNIDGLAKLAARLALLDGVPRAQIESRYKESAMKGLEGMRLDDWHRKLTGEIEHETLAPAKPSLRKKGR